MTTPAPDLVAVPADADFLREQPHAVVEREGVRYTLLGTAHVSRASVDAVEAAIASGRYDAIAVELDPQRHRALTDPNALAKMDLFQIIREGKTGLVAANLALAAYQRRLAEQLGVEPGAELKAAAIQASERGLPLYLIDRDVGITLKRAWYGLGWWGRMKLMVGLGGSLFVDEKVDENEIEKLKQGDMLEASFGEFAKGTPILYEKIISERDHYMAAKLRESTAVEPPREVLAVVGAGHLKGLSEHLAQSRELPATAIANLDTLPRPSRVPWFTLIFTVLLFSGFAWGYWHGGAKLGTGLVLQWVLLTGGLGALGCLLAGGHPLSIATAMVMAPLKPFHPGIPAGTFSAGVEAWLRKPTYADFLTLRDDSSHLRGWWRNRVARTLLNFLLTNIGTATGVWIAGVAIFSRLF